MQYEELGLEREALLRSLADRADRSQAARRADDDRNLHHVSGLLRSIQRELHLDSSYDDEISRSTLLRFEVGYIWEDILGEHLFAPTADPEHIVPVGTLEQDGILATPDDFDTRTWEVQEYKASWSSSRKPLDSRWYWLSQIKIYCHLMGARSAKLKVFYVNGDWRPPAPDVRIYRLCWEPDECEAAWEMAIAHRQWLQGQGGAKGERGS